MERTIPLGVDSVPVRALRVTVLRGPDQGRVVTSTDALSVGTAASNDLVLADETASRYHFELQRIGEAITLVDHGSTNGTRVGGAYIERGRLVPGTVIQVGRSELQVDDGEARTIELHSEREFSGLVGRSAGIRALMAKAERAARSEASVLILGETGTGKEVLARAIHESSSRRGQPFETVDCASMAPTLIGSELFGHEKGAFTGAFEQHAGAFERADGGTVFLDEIGELPSTLQTALLGVLERRSFRRLGGKALVEVDVRVVAATHRDLRSEVNAGTFRQDLYYRMAVVLLRLPPLRERLEDLPDLVEHFLRRAGRSESISDVLPESTLAAMRQHRWPGNVRELRNTVEAALALGTKLELEDAEPLPVPSDESTPHGLLPSKDSGFWRLPYSEAKHQLTELFEDRFVRQLLERCDGRVKEAAEQAEMSRSYLTRVLRRRGIRGTKEE